MEETGGWSDLTLVQSGTRISMRTEVKMVTGNRIRIRQREGLGSGRYIDCNCL